MSIKNMAKASYHMHTVFCDGKSVAEDYVLKAMEKGMESIGFSAHVPVHIDNIWNMKSEKTEYYFKEIYRLRDKYAGQIEIYAGFEMDYLAKENKDLIKKYVSMADYTIGAVHYLYDAETDEYCLAEGTTEDVKKAFAVIGKGNNKKCVEQYYSDLIKVVMEYRPDIVAHLDIIKKQNNNNMYFDEKDPWYIDLINNVLNEIAKIGTIVEVNNGAILYNSLDDTYPATWILKMCYEKKIPIVVSSDAHKAEDIDGLFSETIATLREIGFTHQKMLKAGKWVDVEL